MRIAMTGAVAVYLGILGIRDFRKGDIPVGWFVTGTPLFLGYCMMQIVCEELTWTEVVLGVLPGAGMFLVAWLTKKMGYADGIVLLQLGIALGYRQCLILLVFSMLLTAMISVGLLAFRKAGRETQIPYLPFLFWAYGILKLVL